jgi:hypothetical protein
MTSFVQQEFVPLQGAQASRGDNPKDMGRPRAAGGARARRTRRPGCDAPTLGAAALRERGRWGPAAVCKPKRTPPTPAPAPRQASAPKYEPSVVFATWEGSYISSGARCTATANSERAREEALRPYPAAARHPLIPAPRRGTLPTRQQPIPPPRPLAGSNPAKEFEPITLTAVIDGVFACKREPFSQSKLFTFRQLGLTKALQPAANAQGLQAMCSVTPMSQARGRGRGRAVGGGGGRGVVRWLARAVRPPTPLCPRGQRIGFQPQVSARPAQR